MQQQQQLQLQATAAAQQQVASQLGLACLERGSHLQQQQQQQQQQLVAQGRMAMAVVAG
jgi:hypothetical protein